jgi:hypothetical protein
VQGNYESECPEHETLDPFKQTAAEAGTLFVAAGGFKAEEAAEKLRTGGADIVRSSFSSEPAVLLVTSCSSRL